MQTSATCLSTHQRIATTATTRILGGTTPLGEMSITFLHTIVNDLCNICIHVSAVYIYIFMYRCTTIVGPVDKQIFLQFNDLLPTEVFFSP